MSRPARPSRRLLASLLLALAVPSFSAGCGGDTPSTTLVDPDGGLSPDGASTTTTPAVVSTTPANGALGVEADETIVVRFSEPMDTASVEAAYASTDLPSGSVQMSWNAAKDELEIVPAEPFDLAFGDAATPPKTYSVAIGAGARSAAGVELGDALVLSFSTLRRVMTEEPAVASLTGRATSVGTTSVNYLGAGDFVGNTSAVSVATFSIASLPAGVRLDSAYVVATELSVTGSPDTDLGALRGEHVFFTDFDASVYSAPVLDSLPNTSASERSKGPPYLRVVDVTGFVLDDLANREARSDLTQVRLRYPTATDSDAATDLLAFEVASLRIRYIVLVP